MTTFAPPFPLDASPLARAVAVFFRWWRGELAGLLPARLRRMLDDERPYLFVSISDDHISFSRTGREGQSETILEWSSTNENIEASASALRDQLERMTDKPFRLMLSVPAQAVFKRRVTLPSAIEENLGQTLEFELDRFTPFNPKEAHFDFRLLGRDPSRQTIEVDLAVARRSIVEKIDQQARLLDLPVEGIAFAGEVLGGNAGLHPGSDETPGRSRRFWLRFWGGTLVLALAVVFLAVPIWQKRAAAISLLQPLAEAREASMQTDAQRELLDRLVAEHNTLSEKKWAAPSLVRIIDEVSLRLKDDTFVAHFSLEGKVIVLQGESGSGAGLAEALDASPLFHNAIYKSPLVRLPGGTNDRFHVSMEISPEGLPPPPTMQPTEAATTP
jgi:general secretion pathway protein L